ncbi:S-layer homology domain-containing protein [Bacillus ndiopicus]|uniref:S-layer homology domain-containing protein n=1 Tax=Bacillus ndiopicus TaxID=1347368 RepID=UPI0005A79120|nr:S-layer homology domain-containing protein [Bacillus ndiopicus]
METLSSGTYRIVFKFNAGDDAVFELTITHNIEEPSLSTPDMEKPQEKTIDFGDVDAEFWANGVIQSLVLKGIILGYSNNEFRPNELIRREHMVVMFSRLGLLTEQRKAAKFTDVPVEYVYYNEIRLAQLAGIIDGSDGKFYPKQPLTRAQAAKIIVLLFGFETEGAKSFKDVPENA